ncbi:hypothetical protein OG698_38610 [Streptomyces sp. NBC_01003]|uniref:hypothetical protein n=1 Tax=Streptomyces sp. NBC_01003 TaxID=2903714 RepID=UPI00386D33F9|nr:hypothetical protein OG698_38610 [Streptomyces sp. NBC_01003]
MEDGRDVQAEEAGEWLRERFKDDPEPSVDITLVVGEPNPTAYREVMEILFGPPVG